MLSVPAEKKALFCAGRKFSNTVWAVKWKKGK